MLSMPSLSNYPPRKFHSVLNTQQCLCLTTPYSVIQRFVETVVEVLRMSYAYIHILIFSQGDIIFVHNFQMAKSVRDWTHHRCACMDNLPLCMTGTAAPCLLAAEIADEMGKDRVTWYVWIDINTNYFLIKIMYKWIYALAACIANMYQYFVLCRCFFM